MLPGASQTRPEGDLNRKEVGSFPLGSPETLVLLLLVIRAKGESFGVQQVDFLLGDVGALPTFQVREQKVSPVPLPLGTFPADLGLFCVS